METTESKYLKKLIECRKLKEKCAYQEAMIEQMMSGCDGKCALHECICEKDQRLIDLKEYIAQLEFEKSNLEFQIDEFEKAANFDKLKDMIEANDIMLPEFPDGWTVHYIEKANDDLATYLYLKVKIKKLCPLG